MLESYQYQANPLLDRANKDSILGLKLVFRYNLICSDASEPHTKSRRKERRTRLAWFLVTYQLSINRDRKLLVC